MSESTAIVSYILSKYPASPGATRMIRTPEDPDYATYLEWYHYANGSLQLSMSRMMSLFLAGASAHPVGGRYRAKLDGQLRALDQHLGRTNAWFAGPEVSAADCMMMFSLSTMRGFVPLDLGPYAHVLRWMRDVAARPAYRRAVEKGDRGMDPMIGPNVRKFTEFPPFREALGRLEGSSS